MTDIVYTDERVGDTARLTYSSLGLRFPMTMTVVDHDKPKKLALEMQGGMRGTMTFSLEPQGDATKFTWRIDYTMKGGILGKAIDSLLVERMNEKNAERSLENLKMLCEATQ